MSVSILQLKALEYKLLGKLTAVYEQGSAEADGINQKLTAVKASVWDNKVSSIKLQNTTTQMVVKVDQLSTDMVQLKNQLFTIYQKDLLP